MTRTFKVVTLKNVCLTFQTLFTDLGFVINVDKSCVIPAQQINFLGFVLDSVSITITLTDDKKAKVKSLCNQLLLKSHSTITELAQLVGTLVSCLTTGV